MIRFIPTSSGEVADKLSNALWSLSRPENIRGADTTQRMFSLITCLNGSVWLQVDTEIDTPVHPLAELGEIEEIMQPWIERGLLPANTNADLEALIVGARGLRLNVYDSFPKLFKDQSKTYEELIKLGLLQEPKL